MRLMRRRVQREDANKSRAAFVDAGTCSGGTEAGDSGFKNGVCEETNQAKEWYRGKTRQQGLEEGGEYDLRELEG